MTRPTARYLWQLLEPYHALTYFAPESHQAYEDAGLRGFWRGYSAGRAAPLGQVGSGVVTACSTASIPTSWPAPCRPCGR